MVTSRSYRIAELDQEIADLEDSLGFNENFLQFLNERKLLNTYNELDSASEQWKGRLCIAMEEYADRARGTKENQYANV